MEGVEPNTVWTWNAVGKQARRVGTRARRAGGHDRLPAEPPDLPSTCRRPATTPRLHQFRSGHRPGGVVRPARARHASARRARRARGPRSIRCRAAGRRAAPDAALERAMKLGLVIDLDTCVGCHACATACKEWNGASAISGPLTDDDPYGADPSGVWLNRVRHYEVGAYPGQQDDQFPDVVPALRGGGVRHRVPDRRVVQARGRHRAGRPGQVHGLQPVRLGLPVRRARARHVLGHDEEMHAVRRPHPRRALPEDERQPACVLACPTHARHFGDFDDPAVEGVAAHGRARRLRPAATSSATSRSTATCRRASRRRGD